MNTAECNWLAGTLGAIKTQIERDLAIARTLRMEHSCRVLAQERNFIQRKIESLLSWREHDGAKNRFPISDRQLPIGEKR